MGTSGGEGESGGDPGFKCATPGSFPDPANCQVFYECVQRSDAIVAFRKECVTGTVFNPNNKLCAWPHDVPSCKGYVAPVDVDVQQEIAEARKGVPSASA